MKVISLPEIASRIRCRRSGKTFLVELINQCKIEDAIIIPEGATNGDVIKAVFPVLEVEIEGDQVTFWIDEYRWLSFRLDWWNAPYKKGEVKE